jgi:Calx-beta domain
VSPAPEETVTSPQALGLRAERAALKVQTSTSKENLMRFHDLIDTRQVGGSRPPPRSAKCGVNRRRPVHRRLAVEALDPRIVPASLMVSNATVAEGNAGIQFAVVRVSLDVASAHAVTVNYNTVNGTAGAGSDYQAVTGKLSFARGETSKAIKVPVIGDRRAESDETFVVKLSGAKGATIADCRGLVTIVDDEPRINIDGAFAAEGNSGTKLFTFNVSLSAAYDETVSLHYTTADGSATTADNDYVASSGALTFAPGETTKTIKVEVVGDITAELDEMFYVNLSGASTNARLVNHQGIGSIIDDDLPDQPGGGDGCTADNPYFPNC